MGKKTINQALKDLFLGLGGNPSALSDNTSVSDYIEDLEGAIKGETSSIIDDTQASESTTYSSSNIESLIPSPELPTVYEDDNGKVLTVVNGAWAKSNPILVVTTFAPSMSFPSDIASLMPSERVSAMMDIVKAGRFKIQDTIGSNTVVLNPSSYVDGTNKYVYFEYTDYDETYTAFTFIRYEVQIKDTGMLGVKKSVQYGVTPIN